MLIGVVAVHLVLHAVVRDSSLCFLRFFILFLLLPYFFLTSFSPFIYSYILPLLHTILPLHIDSFSLLYIPPSTYIYSSYIRSSS